MGRVTYIEPHLHILLVVVGQGASDFELRWVFDLVEPCQVLLLPIIRQRIGHDIAARLRYNLELNFIFRLL